MPHRGRKALPANNDAWTQDAFSRNWRRWLRPLSRPGIIKQTRRRFHKTMRRTAAREIEEQLDDELHPAEIDLILHEAEEPPMPAPLTKVSWSEDDTIRPLMPWNFEDEERHEIPNDVMKLSQYEGWRDFANGDYYDGTPPPEFVVVTKRCKQCDEIDHATDCPELPMETPC